MRGAAMRKERMKLVTYDAGAGPRVGVLRRRRRRRRRLRRRHGRVHRGGRAGRTAAAPGDAAPVCWRRCGRARCATSSPSRATSRTPIRNLGRDIPAGVVRGARLLQGHARHRRRPRRRGRRGRRTPTSSTTSSSSPPSSAGRVKDVAPQDAAGCIFGYTIWNDFSARDVQRREVPVGMGPGKAKDWDGSNVLGPCIVTADEFDATDARHARARQRRDLGRGHDAPTCTTRSPT